MCVALLAQKPAAFCAAKPRFWRSLPFDDLMAKCGRRVWEAKPRRFLMARARFFFRAKQRKTGIPALHPGFTSAGVFLSFFRRFLLCVAYARVDKRSHRPTPWSHLAPARTTGARRHTRMMTVTPVPWPSTAPTAKAGVSAAGSAGASSALSA